TTPRAHRTPTLTAASPKGMKRRQKEEIKKMVKGEEEDESYASVFADFMLNDDVDDSGTRIEPESHKEHSENVNDDDDDEIEKEKKDDDNENVEKTDEVVKEKENDDQTHHALVRSHVMGSMEF
nr:hypothetical protein [Tanacetum cinerariifolium]